MIRPLGWAAALLLALAPGPSAAQTAVDIREIDRLHLDDIHAGPRGERVVEVYFRAVTRFGVPVKGIAPSDIEIWQDDDQIDPADVEIKALQATGRGVATVLAIDVSGTMRGEPFGRAKEAALAFLDRLDPEDRVAVVSFAEDVRVVAGFDLQREETRQALRTLEIDLERSQHTLLFDGAYRAVDLIRTTPGLPRRAFVILFSDGKDGGSDRSRTQVIKASEGGGEESHILIFTLGYARFGGGGMDEMRRLAESTGGDFLKAASMVHLRDFFDAIATQVTNSYLGRFPASMDGERHTLRIAAAGKSADREALYPEISGPIWPWLLALGLLVLAALGFFLFQRGRTAGRLSIVSGPRAGTVVALKTGRTRIGALEDNDVALPGTTVSRYHAEIIAKGRNVQISDLQSKNGTHVNGQSVQRSPLQPGDKIRLADVELVFER